jgi:hypothetical protein
MVQDPSNCARKDCVDWQRWFLVEWDKIHGFYKKYMEGKVKEDG